MPAEQGRSSRQAAGVEDVARRVAQPRRAIRTPHCTQSSALTKWASDETTSRGAFVERQPHVAVVQIEPFDLAVDLERHAARPTARGDHVVHRGAGCPRAAAAAGRWGGPARPPSGTRARAARGRSSAPRPARSASGWTPPRCRAAARQSSARSSEPSARMSHSMPASSVSPSKRPFSARTRAACSSARRSSRPLAIASDLLWSVMAMYS